MTKIGPTNDKQKIKDKHKGYHNQKDPKIPLE